MKKFLNILIVFSLLLLLISGCSNDRSTEPKAPSENKKEQEVEVKKKISLLIPGNEKDNGFMEAAFRGYERIQQELDVQVSYVSNVSATSDAKVLTEELRKLASEAPNLIIAHGGQNNQPVQTVSAEYPDIQFVVIQGNVQGENLSSYAVDQEQSAWLAGALAGYSTQTNKVGHISGAWPEPGLRARAAFYDGIMYVKPDVEFYSTFTGNLDDIGINGRAAEAQIEAGADVIYTMLNGGRTGVNRAIEKTTGSVKQIGNVIDWTEESEIFIGSAVADSSVLIFNAAKDFIDGKLESNTITTIGLENEEIVRLAVAESVPEEIKTNLSSLAEQIKNGEIEINTKYYGKEFNAVTGEFVDQSYKETTN